MSTQRKSGMTWPTHSSGGLHDWWTYLERGIVEPFKDAIRDIADVDVPFEGGGTMLMLVLPSVRGKPWMEIVALLIKKGADVNRRNPVGIPVWRFAPISDPSCVELWRMLIHAGLDVNSRDEKQATPLIYACSGYLDPATDRSFVVSRLSVVQLLLDAGAEVNVVNQYNDSPLRAAAGAGNSETVKILLKAGANPNLTGTGTRGALFEAAIHGHALIVQALLQAGALIDAATASCRMKSYPVFTSGYMDVEGVTPLIAAAEGGYFQVVRLLVDAGADVNRADSSGFTPLMGAARAGHPKMVQFLLERGAGLDAVDASGRNAQTHAAEFQHQSEIAPILQRARNKDGSF